MTYEIFHHGTPAFGVVEKRSGFRRFGEDCLSGEVVVHTSERVPQPPESASIAGDPQGHARAGMVLGPFAETKGPRRARAKPRI